MQGQNTVRQGPNLTTVLSDALLEEESGKQLRVAGTGVYPVSAPPGALNPSPTRPAAALAPMSRTAQPAEPAGLGPGPGTGPAKPGGSGATPPTAATAVTATPGHGPPATGSRPLSESTSAGGTSAMPVPASQATATAAVTAAATGAAGYDRSSAPMRAASPRRGPPPPQAPSSSPDLATGAAFELSSPYKPPSGPSVAARARATGGAAQTEVVVCEGGGGDPAPESASEGSSGWRAARRHLGPGGPRAAAAASARVGGGAKTGKGQAAAKPVASTSMLSRLATGLQDRARAIGKLSMLTRAWMHVNKYGEPLPRRGGGGGGGGGDGSAAQPDDLTSSGLEASSGEPSISLSTLGSSSAFGAADGGGGGGVWAEDGGCGGCMGGEGGGGASKGEEGPPPGWRAMAVHVREVVWRVMTNPDSSRLALAVSMVVMGAILLSTVAFCLETLPSLSADRDPAADSAFKIIETVTVQLFAADYLLRLASCPQLLPFLVSPFNVIDLVSVVPWYVELALAGSNMQGTAVFRVLRLLRVFRVLKLGSRYRKLLVVMWALGRSLDMLVLMSFFVSLTVVTSATLIYFAERGTYDEALGYYVRQNEKYTQGDGDPIVSPFESIPAGFWWAVVTLMTVGYGDVVPISAGGRFIAAATMLCGILSIALPVAVIGTNFSTEWEAAKKRDAAEAAAAAAAAAAKRGSAAAAAAGAGVGVAAAAGPSPRVVSLERVLKSHVTTADDLNDMLQEAVTRMSSLHSEFRDQGDLRVREMEELFRPAAAAAAAATARSSRAASTSGAAANGGAAGGVSREPSVTGGGGGVGGRRRLVGAVESAREVVALLARLGLEDGGVPGRAPPLATTSVEPAAEAEGWRGQRQKAEDPQCTTEVTTAAAAVAVAGGGGSAPMVPGLGSRLRSVAVGGVGWGEAAGFGAGGDGGGGGAGGGAGGWAGILELEDPEPREETADRLRAALRALRGTPLHARMLEEVHEALAKEAEAAKRWRQLEQALRCCRLLCAGQLPELTDLMRSQYRQLSSLVREASSLRGRLGGLEEAVREVEEAVERARAAEAAEAAGSALTLTKNALFTASASMSSFKLPSRSGSGSANRPRGPGAGGGDGGDGGGGGGADVSTGRHSHTSGGWTLGLDGSRSSSKRAPPVATAAAAAGAANVAAAAAVPPPLPVVVLTAEAAEADVAAAATLPAGSPTAAAPEATSAAAGGGEASGDGGPGARPWRSPALEADSDAEAESALSTVTVATAATWAGATPRSPELPPLVAASAAMSSPPYAAAPPEAAATAGMAAAAAASQPPPLM